LQPEGATARWYADKVRRYGFDHRGLGFRTQTSQHKRFDAAIAMGELDGASLLDVGCGFGDLLDYLAQRRIRPREYVGLDVCEPMIRRCRERFATHEFVVGDVLAYEPRREFDYVIASGIFGLDAEGARERIRPTLERMFAWARIGLSANFLSRRSPAPAEGRVYVEPTEVLAMALEITPAVRLDHSYLPNDFTLHLFKTPAWQGEKASAT
jgi:SAM-dependent methyltransferase